MAAYLTGGLGWASGYRAISVIQAVLCVMLVISLPLWSKTSSQVQAETETPHEKSGEGVLRVRGVKEALIGFSATVPLKRLRGFEATMGL